MSQTDYVFNAFQYEKMKELLERVDNGYRPIVIINSEIFEDSYLESGMKARIVRMVITEEVQRKTGVNVECQFTLDFSEFVEFNQMLETAEYRNEKTGKYDLTATQANAIPSDFKEDVFHSISYGKIFFEEISESSAALYAEFKQGSGDSYIGWLESELLKARGNKD